jgi:thioredoxin reductase (NADPH)
MLKAALLERGVPGGELLNTEKIEDYPGFVSILGPDLAAKMTEHAQAFGRYPDGERRGHSPAPRRHLPG